MIISYATGYPGIIGTFPHYMVYMVARETPYQYNILFMRVYSQAYTT